MMIAQKEPILPMLRLPHAKPIPLLKDLPPEQVRSMLQALPHTSLGRKEFVYLQKEKKNSFYFLLKGYVNLFTYTRDLKKSIFEVLVPGDSMGESTLFHQSYQEYAQGVKGGIHIAICHRDQWREWVLQHPILQLNLTEVLNIRVGFFKKRLALGNELMLVRLLTYLKYSLQKRGIERGEEIWIPRVLSHENIASFINGSRQTVSVELGRLKDQQKIDYNTDFFIIKQALLQEIKQL